MNEFDYNILPGHIQGTAQRYIEHGVPPGDFLTAVICNKLKESFERADDTNIRRIFDIVNFFYNEAPSLCWGSVEDMNTWIEHKGMEGIKK